MSTSVAYKRLLGDLRKMQTQTDDGYTAAPRDASLLVWDAYIFGPPNSPWEGGIFRLCLQFGEGFPIAPPKVHFVSDVFHPNVYPDSRPAGYICLDILESAWTPIYGVTQILQSIQALLTDPAPHKGVPRDADQLYLHNREEYNQRVRECATKSREEAIGIFP